jgi:hypothetical protein
VGRKKRSRGGQPGNQNARKHGVYAKNLDLEALDEFYNLINQGGTAPDIAAVRLKLEFVRRHDPGNPRLLREVAGLFYKTSRTRFNLAELDRQGIAEMNLALRKIKELFFAQYCSPEPTEAKS